MRTRTALTTAVIASLLTACTGGGHANLLAPMTAAKGTATLRIAVPARVSQNARTPHYVSPATTQLSIDVQQGGVSVSGYPITAGLTPTSTGCTSTLANTICELTISLAPGSYTATLTAMDSANAVLSTAQSIAFTIAPATNNTISLTLSGVPKEIQVLPLDYVTTPSAGLQSYTLLGAGPHRFLAVALDADGNTIIGPGAPTFSASISGFTGTVGQPTTARPNVFTVSPPSAFDTSTGSVSVTASYAGQATDGCTQTGAVCSAGIKVNMNELIAVPNASEVDLYVPGQTTALAKITPSNAPNAIAFDSSGNLFVAGGRGTIQEFSPPFTTGMSSSATTTVPVPNGTASRISQLVCDNAGHVYAAATYINSLNTSSYVLDRVPVPLSSGTTLFDTGTSSGVSFNMAVDGSGNLFATAEQNQAYMIAPDGTTTTLSNIVGQMQVAVAADGTVAFNDGSTISYYSSPYTGTAFATQSIGAPLWIAFDSSANLYIASSAGPYSLYAVASPYTSAPYATIPVSSFANFVVAGQNEVFFRIGATVYQYALPLTSSSSAVASYPASRTAAMAVSP